MRTQIVYLLTCLCGLGKQSNSFGEKKGDLGTDTSIIVFYPVHIQQLDIVVILKVLIQLCFWSLQKLD